MLPEIRTVQASTKEDSVEDGSESENKKSLELPPALEIENSALHYFNAAGSYQREETTKRAARPSMIDLAVHFCRCGAI